MLPFKKFFFKEFNTFIQQRHIKLFTSDFTLNIFTSLPKIYISNTANAVFELSIHQ